MNPAPLVITSRNHNPDGLIPMIGAARSPGRWFRTATAYRVAKALGYSTREAAAIARRHFNAEAFA